MSEISEHIIRFNAAAGRLLEEIDSITADNHIEPHEANLLRIIVVKIRKAILENTENRTLVSAKAKAGAGQDTGYRIQGSVVRGQGSANLEPEP